jgi:CheY-like chemotaxis protein
MVAFLGFESVDEDRLSRIFQMERLNERKYIATGYSATVRSDILLVNYDNPAALRQKEIILGAYPQTQVIAVSRGPLEESPNNHIRGMLIAARVLNVIDKVLIESLSEIRSDSSRGDVVSKLQQYAEISEPKLNKLTSKNENTVVLKATTQEGYCALVVDDSPAIQKSLQLNLATLLQIRLIDFAISGESAIEKAEAKQYDLIFLDVMMPGIDGYETCTRLRKKMEYKKTPIVMVSGKTSPLDEVKGVMAGCTTYLTKPVQPEAFHKLSVRILTWLERQKKS